MSRQITTVQALNEAIKLAMRADERVIVMGEDVVGGTGLPHLEEQNIEAVGGAFRVTKGCSVEFGRERVLDTPISENTIVGTGVGAAITGLRPIVEVMFNDFLGYCLDAVMNQAAKFRYMYGGKANVPLVVRMPFGAGYGAGAQHSQTLYSMVTSVPGLKVVVPSSPYDAKGLLLAAVEDNDPVIFFESISLYGLKGEVPEGYYTIPLGKAEIKRAGSDVTIVAIGNMVQRALQAAEQLAAKGIDAEVVDPRTLSPLDEDTILASVEKTNRLVIVDESNPRCSAAADIAAIVQEKAFDNLDAPIKRVNAPHTPVPFSKPLEDLYTPSAENIIRAVAEVVNDESIIPV
ncbi:alpha-ketoacid dehydrogenase subunit beta [Neobacillus mesonae]|uniref:alpha-ketoacid dehydrogenase subunit beta n=1 Tax=Neobacillus mesonae TaxID=1193713 RepID=UPI00203A8616|nr:alpha-ketoacid dehydrogenase subunit beta [Neobacillus mesonae]MCM3567504.1 alpha-ketoacid dehydrogenase subunit beta [Neobacillus mesonae]